MLPDKLFNKIIQQLKNYVKKNLKFNVKTFNFSVDNCMERM